MTKAKLKVSKGLVSLLPLLWPEAPCYDLTFQRQIQGCLVVTSQPLQAPLFSPSSLMLSADSCPKPLSWAQGADKDGHGEREAFHDTSLNIRKHKLQYIKKTEVGIFVTYHTNQTTLVHETHRTIYQESSKHAVAIVLLKKRKEKKGVQSALSRNFCKQCFFLLYHHLK